MTCSFPESHESVLIHSKSGSSSVTRREHASLTQFDLCLQVPCRIILYRRLEGDRTNETKN